MTIENETSNDNFNATSHKTDVISSNFFKAMAKEQFEKL